jgi:hypothetical protein
MKVAPALAVPPFDACDACALRRLRCMRLSTQRPHAQLARPNGPEKLVVLLGQRVSQEPFTPPSAGPSGMKRSASWRPGVPASRRPGVPASISCCQTASVLSGLGVTASSASPSGPRQFARATNGWFNRRVVGSYRAVERQAAISWGSPASWMPAGACGWTREPEEMPPVAQRQLGGRMIYGKAAAEPRDSPNRLRSRR